jgi:UDP-N-acetylglucosamine 2-epimerase (non-hydrolysing)
MKIMTILGTRPEIIRLSGVIRLLDQHADHVLAHTGQNYDGRLSQIFFDELGVRDPDVFMGVRADGFAGQIGQILERSEALFLKYRPDRLLILGDTNSGMAAVVARRLGIPVYHMEAGNRCYDDRVPEEVNRRVIDHSSSVLLPYTQRSRENLLREGFATDRVYVTGNPIGEVLQGAAEKIQASKVLEEHGLQERRYFLVTLHRAENVDTAQRLRGILAALETLGQEYGFPVICSLHPRTLSKLEKFGIQRDGRIRFIEPRGFVDFVRLEKSAFCILSDSGTVQEEACIFRMPNVTLRDVTERPETLECGSNMLSGCDGDSIHRAVRFVTSGSAGWSVPPEYEQRGVAQTVCRIVLGYRHPDAAEREWREGVRI